MLKPLRWQQTRKSPWKRQLDIFRAVLMLVLLWLWDKLWRKNSPRQRQRRARRLARTLIELGPTFIKLGQALSTRSDLLSVEYIQALSALQDQVPPFESESAIAIIESEFHKPLYSLYREFDLVPLASASLGQVHKAILHTGEEVVVKVQRPGLKQQFDLDFGILHRLIELGNRFFSGLRKYKLEGIYQEFTKLLYSEIDYLNEGKNAEQFRTNFLEDPQIIAPLVYWNYTTPKVLTLEYLPGIKVDDRESIEACGLDPRVIIQLGITAFLKQLLLDGFFQTDPHPGNMAVSQEGHLIFYDFGTMMAVKPVAKDQMINTFFAVLRKDTEEVVTTLAYMGLLEPVADMTPVKRLVGFLLERFTERPVDIRELEEIRAEIRIMFEQQPFRLPPQMTFILKAISTLDGIARALDPQYNLMAASQPFVKKLTVSDSDKRGTAKVLLRQGVELIRTRLTQPRRRGTRLRQLETRFEQERRDLSTRLTHNEEMLQRLQTAWLALIYAGLSGFTFVAGVVLIVGEMVVGAIAIFLVSAIWFVILLHSLTQF
jgi:predicted unusual protein kinase regulating ubiquinone biosynthesis (AarF/ABC1/UbiB family)